MKTDLQLVAFAVLMAVLFMALGAGVLGVFAGSPLVSSRARQPALVAPEVVVTPERAPAPPTAACDVPATCAG